MSEQLEKNTEIKKPTGRLVLIIGIFLILIGVLIGIYFFINGIGKQDYKVLERNKEVCKKEGICHLPSEKFFYFDIQDMFINLFSNSTKENILKISISIEFSNIKLIEKMKILKPRLIDQYQVFLRSLRIEEIRGSSGLEHIREEILRRTNLIVAPDKVTNILFREVIIK